MDTVEQTIFGFLGDDSPESLPEGGVFTNSGFIGQLLAQKLWVFWSREDIALYELEYKADVDYHTRGKDESWWYYFVSGDAGRAAAEALQAFMPSHVWRFETPTNTVLNFQNADAAERWGKAIGADARLVTLGSNKYRHQFHMMGLPAIVDALARRAGFIKETIWHCAELLSAQDEELTDKFQWRMIGHPDANNDDAENMAVILEAVGGNLDMAHNIALGTAEDAPKAIADLVGNVKIHYTFATLWQRKAALWAALGEEDARVYLPIDGATTERGKKLETTSANLSLCLSVTTREWTAPIWAQVYLVKDPSVGSAYTSKSSGLLQRPLLPVVGEIFASEAIARKSAGSQETAVITEVNEKLPLPEQWEGSNIQDWISILSDEKKDVNGVLPNVVGLVVLAKKLSCDPDDIKAWWEIV